MVKRKRVSVSWPHGRTRERTRARRSATWMPLTWQLAIRIGYDDPDRLISYPEAPFLSTTELPIQNTHTTGERRRERRAWSRCQRGRGTCQGTRRRWRGQAAVLVGGGRARAGLETRRIVLSTTGPTGVEATGGTGEPGCGARGWRRGRVIGHFVLLGLVPGVVVGLGRDDGGRWQAWPRQISHII